MPFDSHTASPAEPVIYDDIRTYSGWSEHIVTVVATGIGVMIVAVIAVLIGMT